MTLEGRQQRLTVYVGESDHRGRILSLSGDLPVVIVDRPEAVAPFLPQLGGPIIEGLVVLDVVEVVKYVGRPRGTP